MIPDPRKCPVYALDMNLDMEEIIAMLVTGVYWYYVLVRGKTRLNSTRKSITSYRQSINKFMICSVAGLHIKEFCTAESYTELERLRGDLRTFMSNRDKSKGKTDELIKALMTH